MENRSDGNAIVFCEGTFGNLNGKTAHGLVRFTERYKVLSVVDSTCAGRDAGKVLDGRDVGIPVFESTEAALQAAEATGRGATHFIVGIAPDGGRITPQIRQGVLEAIRMGLNVDCGLHDYLTEDSEVMEAADRAGKTVRDIRKPPPREELHLFSGKIEEVNTFKVAILGTDSAVGKRTTAWILVRALRKAGVSVEMVGTGQTAWMQGAKYIVLMDSLINDFVSGEVEHAVWSAWNEMHPDVIIIEGQGSLMNPAYPGGFEILAAARPDAVIMQHAPMRKDYDGFPGYPIHELPRQIKAVQVISDSPVAALALNHEHIPPDRIRAACEEMHAQTGIPVFDPLLPGDDEKLASLIAGLAARHGSARLPPSGPPR